ncbi:double zinc ribbon and ankyrin repeat-containing protein 1 isoform X2 [Mugil cephalus]|uniref:double zinc ribbon and ankyrin repeat-containing protein 1 isoform X2 n=1 Tax=Mugil cephalus TaxID=48193 RepID=UPI001FB5F022|nr:double zinc ribbon and ankyrin repeat-containing protein 1 isoform X2 [Mugil cephalus]
MAAGAVSAPLIIPIVHLQTHRTKNHISTRTPVSIQSDTAGALVFYTLDGSTPAAEHRGSGGGGGGGRKYSESILLPAGRTTVRAVAVTSDGRQSSVVTKVFLVVDEDDALQRSSEAASCSAGPSPRHSEPRTKAGVSPHSGTRFLNSRLGSGSAAQTPPTRRSQSASSGEDQLSSTQVSRVQRETDYLRCAQCLSLRPSDPFARFCSQCGTAVPPIPGQRLPPAEGGQVLLCVFCGSLVPANTRTCLVCEASVDQQLQPQAGLRLQDHVLCVGCGSGNPAHVSRCLTCESRLQPVARAGNSAPSIPATDSRKLSCSRCNRMNRGDARYCDWCGAKPGHAASCVMCQRCGASGHPYAFYCAACGAFLEAQAPPRLCEQAPGLNSHDATWQATPSSNPAQSVKVAPPTVDQYTQTVGLYFPSATELQKKEQKEFFSRQRATRDRRALLTPISPGRGYWRKQLDHVCAHLRSYAQNNAPFRTLLGEPRLGRMVSAVIQEDRYEVSLTVSFVSAGRQDQPVGSEGDGVEPTAPTESLSSVTERSAPETLRTNGSDPPSSRKRLPRPNPTTTPPVKDSQLLKELGPGRGQVDAIQQLLDQGADPSCCGGDGRHALTVAVVNGHHDVLPVLVQRGADVDQQSGRTIKEP